MAPAAEPAGVLVGDGSAGQTGEGGDGMAQAAPCPKNTGHFLLDQVGNHVMTKRRSQRGERQIRLKPQYSNLYRGIPSNEWWPAWLMAEKLLELAEIQGISSRDRICDPAHFEFRGGQSHGPRLQDLRTRRSDIIP